MNEKLKITEDSSVSEVTRRRRHIPLEVYDFILLLFVNLMLLGINPSSTDELSILSFVSHLMLSSVCVYCARRIGGIYRQIWRYGSPQAYIRLICADFFAGMLYLVLARFLPIWKISFIRIFSIIAFNLLLALSIRLLYKYLYEAANVDDDEKGFLRSFLGFVAGLTFDDYTGSVGSAQGTKESGSKIRIAIVGAGQVGVMLAEELLKNPRAAYVPCCFIDIDNCKIGREIFGLPVLSGAASIIRELAAYSVQEIVFALPRLEPERTRELYDFYKKTGCKIKAYDFPTIQTADKGKRQMREFDIEELLFRKPIELNNEKINAYYKNKVVLITGGGGSIGSELCRQIARMSPEKLIILDVYENGAYDIQQELKMAYGEKLKVFVEIVSVCDEKGTQKVFEIHKPDIILHAAAHKHVPLMERNVCEAVKNNVFGTLNVVSLSEKYKAERFIMVSTDKAVNPTNVMGATKRVCEMIVQSHSRNNSYTTFSATRFGNVLGSAASVVPLFKKQIMAGGPVTVTDKRITRYFMTIPEASRLVLESGAMAKNGELFVLDMGKSIRILDLAETMIRLCGYEPYTDIDIVETGLRPGEKLYEELLIRTEELDRTESDLIFVERDTPLAKSELQKKLDILSVMLEKGDDAEMKKALMTVVPTYKEPAVVNSEAITEKKKQEPLHSIKKELQYS